MQTWWKACLLFAKCLHELIRPHVDLLLIHPLLTVGVSADGMNLYTSRWMLASSSSSKRVCVCYSLLFVFINAFALLFMCVSGIKTNLRDSQGRTALEILRDHPAPKSQQITALIQGKTCTHTWISLETWVAEAIKLEYNANSYLHIYSPSIWRF